MRTSLKVAVTIVHTNERCGEVSQGSRRPCPWEQEVGTAADAQDPRRLIRLCTCRLFNANLDPQRHRADACLQASEPVAPKAGAPATEERNLLETLLDWSNGK